jgi:AI-2 transport protein TqsA
MAAGSGIKALYALAALVLVLIGARLAAPVLLPLLLAMFLAIVTSPLLGGLTRRGVPVPLAVSAAVLVNLGALGGAGLLVGTSMARLENRLPLYQERLGVLFQDGVAFLNQRGFAVETADLAPAFDPAVLLGMVGGFLRGAAGLLTNLLLVLVILVFILVEAAGLKRKLHKLMGGTTEDVERFTRATSEIQKYLLVKTAASVVTGVVAGLWVWLVGVDLPLVWGLLAFVLNFVPAVGSIIAAVPPIGVAVVMLGPGAAVAVAAGYLAVNMVIGNFLEPRILGRALGLSPLVVLLSVLFWGFVLGPVGALVSVPLTVAAKIFLSNSEDLRWVAVMLGPSPEPAPPPRAEAR